LARRRRKRTASCGTAPYQVFNSGRGEAVELLHFIAALEREFGREAKRNYMPMQPGDMTATCSNTNDLGRLGDHRRLSIDEGVRRFVEWFKERERI